MEDPKCPNHIENARIAGGRDNVVLATEPAVWRYKKAKCVLPAILMAAGSAKIAGAWAVLILPGNLPLGHQTVLGGEPGAHRRHGHTILDFHFAYNYRFE